MNGRTTGQEMCRTENEGGKVTNPGIVIALMSQSDSHKWSVVVVDDLEAGGFN